MNRIGGKSLLSLYIFWPSLATLSSPVTNERPGEGYLDDTILSPCVCVFGIEKILAQFSVQVCEQRH